MQFTKFRYKNLWLSVHYNKNNRDNPRSDDQTSDF
jgi:hypothetical protein